MSNLDLSKIKFKKKIFGGIDELDVLKKIKLINEDYQAVLEHQELKYMNVIKQKDLKIKELENKLNNKMENKNFNE